MFAPDQYTLLDFGHGRKLERFGPWILDRPAPVARRTAPRVPEQWKQAHSRFLRARSGAAGKWRDRVPVDDRWTVSWREELHFELHRNPHGHVGLFPEQAASWRWLQETIRRHGRALRVLNLFAYTGGSTLAAARAGARVTHVDAARNMVRRARMNAARSRLADAPIRWIAEDAQRFVDREHRRGRRYDGIVLDPPTYGHGPRGEPWRLDDDLPCLLRSCWDATEDGPLFFLLTCHRQGWTPADMRRILFERARLHDDRRWQFGYLELESAERALLRCGLYARWTVP